MSRNALAVNFSPPEAAEFRGESYKSSCQILACPEIIENNLVNDSAYDYYTFYKNLSEEFTCVKSVGVYRLFKEKSNYIQAINTCMSLNGDLAQVQSDVLTNSLGTLISGKIKNWTKIAFIGLDDYWKLK
nr:uncharacterized protein LOC111415902 [Onthophagus taurus]